MQFNCASEDSNEFQCVIHLRPSKNVLLLLNYDQNRQLLRIEVLQSSAAVVSVAWLACDGHIFLQLVLQLGMERKGNIAP